MCKCTIKQRRAGVYMQREKFYRFDKGFVAIKKWSMISLFILSFLLLTAMPAFAATGNPYFKDYKQPSGEVFKARVQGDEWANWVETENQEVIVNASDKFWYYGKLEGQSIKATGNKYGIDKAPVKVLKAKQIAEWAKSKKVPSFTLPEISLKDDLNSTTNAPALAPAGANRKALILLVEFDDKTMQNSEATWANTFFGSGAGTVNDYYDEVSNGTFEFLPAVESAGTANNGVIKVRLC